MGCCNIKCKTCQSIKRLCSCEDMNSVPTLPESVDETWTPGDNQSHLVDLFSGWAAVCAGLTGLDDLVGYDSTQLRD